ncbi:DUF5796 family protein [Halobacteriaceae archaeon GCM10025711]
MSVRNDIAPSTVGVEFGERGIVVEYTDGRRAHYLAEPEEVTGTVRVSASMNVQVLVTDPSETEGVMVYVNDRKTSDEILESSGVGRLMLEPGDEEELFPGVVVRGDDYAVEVEADTTEARGRVFVFEEDELGERAYEFVDGE